MTENEKPASTSTNSHDVAFAQVAAVYAKAFLGAARKANSLEESLQELREVVEQVFQSFPRFDALLSTHSLTHEQRLEIIDRTLGSRLSPLVVTFLRVLSEKDRLECLSQIYSHAQKLVDEAHGRVQVVLRTAEPVEEASLNQITQALQTMLGKVPLIQSDIQPEMLGGIVLQIGDTVYDGSVATQLNKLREQMIHRSVHEIQSRRDRFCNSAGD